VIGLQGEDIVFMFAITIKDKLSLRSICAIVDFVWWLGSTQQPGNCGQFYSSGNIAPHGHDHDEGHGHELA
jgi:hypothetical protein